MIVAMYWLLFFLTLETYFGVFSFKRKGKVNNGKKKKQRCYENRGFSFSSK